MIYIGQTISLSEILWPHSFLCCMSVEKLWLRQGPCTSTHLLGHSCPESCLQPGSLSWCQILHGEFHSLQSWGASLLKGHSHLSHLPTIIFSRSCRCGKKRQEEPLSVVIFASCTHNTNLPCSEGGAPSAKLPSWERERKAHTVNIKCELMFQ